MFAGHPHVPGDPSNRPLERTFPAVRRDLIQNLFQIKLILLQIAAIVHGFGTFTTLKEPKGITVTEDSVTDTSLFLTWDAVPKGPFTFKLRCVSQ